MEDLPHCVVQDCVPFGAAAQKRAKLLTFHTWVRESQFLAATNLHETEMSKECRENGESLSQFNPFDERGGCGCGCGPSWYSHTDAPLWQGGIWYIARLNAVPISLSYKRKRTNF